MTAGTTPGRRGRPASGTRRGATDGGRGATGDAVLLGLLTLVAYGLTYGRYGIFRDELYYLANARHLDWGYVDHPPMIAWVTAVVRGLLGESLLALRVVPVLAAVATVVLVVLLARDLGAGRFGRWLAGIAAMLTPGFLALFSFLSMNALDVLVWTLALWLLVRVLDDGDPRLWLAFGLVAGLGLLTKLDVLLLGFAVVAGLLAGGRAEVFRERWIWLGGGLAALLFAPHVAWQVVHGWPTLEFMRRAAELKNVALSAPEFLAEQVMMAGPVNVLLMLAGLGSLLWGRASRRWRPVGIAWLVVLSALLLSNAKPYYLVPSYAPLLAAGAVVAESASRRRGGGVARGVLLGLVVLLGIAAAPLARPVLSPESFVAYARVLGMMPSAGERHELGTLPQHFADRFGWQGLVREVAAVHRALPPEDRTRACVFADNYGEAGAVDLWGPELGLPPAISGHNSYWLWGPGDCSGEVVIAIGADEAALRAVFQEVELGAVYDCDRCMPYEDDNPIWVARRPRISLQELWPQLKNFV